MLRQKEVLDKDEAGMFFSCEDNNNNNNNNNNRAVAEPHGTLNAYPVGSVGKESATN